MNSSNDVLVPSHRSKPGLSQRFVRSRWTRRAAWTLVCLGSLLVLFYQWENWRSARELAAAHQRLIRLLGTDKLVEIAPPPVADEQNYFAIPVIEQWAKQPLTKDGRFKRYDIPQHFFLPEAFSRPELKETPEGSAVIDFQGWAKEQGKMDASIASEEPLAAAMDRQLNANEDLLRQLEAGLSRPFSCLKPGFVEAFQSNSESVGAEHPLFSRTFVLPHVDWIDEHVVDLGIHLRAAAHAGNAAKAQTMARVCLRLFPEAAASHGSVLHAVVGMATHLAAFEALQDALSCPVWDDKSLTLLQAQLAKVNDRDVLVEAMRHEVLWIYPGFLKMRERHARGEPTNLTTFRGKSAGRLAAVMELAYRAGFRWGPAGWLDANIAACLNSVVGEISTITPTSWMDDRPQAHVRAQKPSYNIRRILGSIGLNFDDFMRHASEALFHRRCLIIACALERHRLQHGRFPASLDAIKSDLAGYHPADPARPGQFPSYRLESDGYLLWSAGPDGADDAGDSEKDWLWRMRREKK